MMLSKYHYEQRLLKLADFLATLKPALFDFNRVLFLGSKTPLEAYEAGGGCGTTACAVGWAPKVWPKALKWQDCGVNGFGHHRGTGVATMTQHIEDGEYPWDVSREAASKFFGLSREDVSSLFEPYPSKLGDYATPKMVARHIQKFVAKQRKARGYTGQ